MIKIRKNNKEYRLIERLIYWTNELFYNLERSPEDKEFSAKASAEIGYCLADMERCGLYSDFWSEIMKIGSDWRKCQENYLDTLLKDVELKNYMFIL